MKDNQKTKEQLLDELARAKERVSECEDELSKRSQDQQARLEETQKRFQDFVDNVPIGIYRTTPEGKILLANPALIRMLGYSSLEELATRDLEADGFEPDYSRDDFKKRIERTGEVRSLEVAWKRRDGTTIYLSENARVVRDREGVILYYEGTVEDISDRRQAKQELMVAKDRAEEASRAKSEFLANMGHELRTPLGGMIGMTEILLGTELDDQQRRFASTIKRSAEGLAAIISDLLDFSRLEAGQLVMQPAAFEFRQALDDVVQMLKLPAREKGLELELTVDQQIPARLVGDAGRIRQILTNLTDNAIKFTDQGRVEIAAECLACDDLSTRVRITVKDTGQGIPEGKLDEIFDKFTQVDATSKRRHGGTGLGLAISKQLVQLMGGQLRVDSRLGQGSTFWFELELPRPEETRIRPTRPAQGETSPLILVVEDNLVNQEVIATILGKLGCRVDLASSGREALGLMEQKDFDLIFMDCQMPEMDGFDVTARIRSQEQGTQQHVKIVAMTAHSLDEDRERCLAVGMDDYLAKPASMKDFQQVLRKLGFLEGSKE